jgi:hypothetical protein
VLLAFSVKEHLKDVNPLFFFFTEVLPTAASK